MLRSILRRTSALALCASMLTPALAAAPAAMKQDAAANVDAHAKQVQVMVDTVFSFAEPGFQEIRTSTYLTGILEKNGFKITRGIAGIPTAWTATWGEGGPLIAMGSDEDDLRGLSQVPGISTLKPMVPGAPGHGEGHNSGMPLQITAALAIKAVMEKNHIKGRLMLWPGIAEELLGAKAFYVRAGVFKDVDACVYVHVAPMFGTMWGVGGNGMVSVEYTFHGKTAHAAADPWDGRSALDGVELMDVGINFRREHLPLTQRTHYVITNGGDQPNIVPDLASVWYYFREHDFASVADLYKTGSEIAEAAAKETGTTVTHQLLGEAAPINSNKVLAEALYENIKAVGMPKWTAGDQTFAKAVQTENHLKVQPLSDTVMPLLTPTSGLAAMSGASDDVGDITWNVPTVMMMFPSNIPNLPGHNKLSAMAMATPIAHKGVVAGAKAVAMTVLDLMTTPELMTSTKDYFVNVQTKDQKYISMLSPDDQPAIHRNDEVMAKYRPLMEKFYYDAAKYPTYLDQLGVKYPQ
ncbi:MAG: amidohydrolase [Alphaproteobacteria bacterium]|jgi:aminobenzoyl-glutamate utilization protein B|nr:Amidohydrolase [Alphaproteobacteria bacterium]MDB5739237.1 amidohydrolase [Alphaproteobacteria bacterium]